MILLNHVRIKVERGSLHYNPNLAARTTLAFHMACTTALTLTPSLLASVPQTTPSPASGKKSATLMWCSAKTRLETSRPRYGLRVRRVRRGR